MRRAIVFSLACASFAQAQCETESVVIWPGTPFGRVRHQMTYDLQRDRVVLFGGFSSVGSEISVVWEWDGVFWRQLPSSGAQRDHHAMAYDPMSQRVLHFHGTNFARTHLWDGTQWTRVAEGPPGLRQSPALATDEANQRVVLFGGRHGGAPLGDTWTWDGTQWTLASETGPSPRGSACMAFDRGRNKVILFGGGGFGDTWEWDGSAWTQLDIMSPGPTVGQMVMTYVDQADGLVMFRDVIGVEVQMLRLGPSGWSQLDPPPFSPRNGCEAVYDRARGELLVFGGDSVPIGLYPTDIWSWNGTDWKVLQAAEHRRRPAVGYDADAGQLVVAGGTRYSATGGELAFSSWHWDGSDWAEHPDAPADHKDLKCIWDSRRHKVVVFEWGAQSVREWNGSAWVARATEGVPARLDYGVAYDSKRGRTILFGGFSAIHGLLGDTWAWDGDSWTFLTDDGPPARQFPRMAYDAERDRVVLAGGMITTPPSGFSDTWEFDGASWQVRSPSGAANGELVYNPRRARITSFEVREQPYRTVMFEWDGSQWSGPFGSLSFRSSQPYFDDLHGVPALSGGITLSSFPINSIEGIRMAGPTILTDPRPLAIAPGQGAQFTVVASGATPTYQWRRDRAPLSDGVSPSGALLSGSSGPVLTIAGARNGDSGDYDCFVTDACGHAYSKAAELSVAGGCYANCDGSTAAPQLNVADFTCFLRRFGAGDPYANCDGSQGAPQLTSLDFSCFLATFAAGCP